MRTSAFNLYGLQGTAYVGHDKESIPWHEHAWSHGHKVLAGKTYVQVYKDDRVLAFYWGPENGNYEFPPNVRHQITIVEDYTTFVNCQPMPDRKATEAPQPTGPRVNRVMLESGEIVEEILED